MSDRPSLDGSVDLESAPVPPVKQRPPPPPKAPRTVSINVELDTPPEAQQQQQQQQVASSRADRRAPPPPPPRTTSNGGSLRHADDELRGVSIIVEAGAGRRFDIRAPRHATIGWLLSEVLRRCIAEATAQERPVFGGAAAPSADEAPEETQHVMIVDDDGYDPAADWAVTAIRSSLGFVLEPAEEVADVMNDGDTCYADVVVAQAIDGIDDQRGTSGRPLSGGMILCGMRCQC